MTKLEKLKAKDFIGYIEKHKISKSDVIKLSEYYKNMQPTLGFAKSASYEQENIIPITKSYGFKMWSRSGLENAIQRCILITEGNYDEVISSVENPQPLARADSQEKKEEPVESSQVKANKTSDATKPTSPKKSNTLGCLFTLMIFGALIYLGTGLFKGCEGEATGNAVKSKEIDKSQEIKPNKKITQSEAEAFMKERCRSINQTLMNTKTVNFDGHKLYMFLSVAKNGYVCISSISEYELELLATDCGISEVKVSQWNEL
jgi:hypothetical protein